MQALIGVQTGVVKDERDTLGGDTLTLGEAFRHSSTPAFRELARRIGKDTLKKWIDSLGYGNKDIATDEFWMDNHLTITPDEQLGLIKKLYFDQLPFFPHSQKLVRQMMEMEGNSNYQLIYKKATGVAKNGHAFSWYIGWIEENKHPYFFVLNLDAAAGVNTEQAGLGILKNILKQLGFFLGKK
jgi:beta-lactamase class D